jgi:DNA-binding NarL/FixJ family response regulator
MSYRIFISHSAKDKHLAQDLAQRLKEAGATVIVDQTDFSPGKELRHKLRETLSTADEVVVLLTDNSAHSPWTRYEIGVADALNKRVTPVVVNEGVQNFVPMIGANIVRYNALPEYISSLRKRTKAT